VVVTEPPTPETCASALDEYKAKQQAVLDRMARLRAMRLAKEAQLTIASPPEQSRRRSPPASLSPQAHQTK